METFDLGALVLTLLFCLRQEPKWKLPAATKEHLPTDTTAD